MIVLFKRHTVLIVVLLFSIQTVFATDYYCDPTNGNNKNNGSKENPWGTLERVFADGKKMETGDVIYLLSGNHGDVIIIGENTKYIKIIGVEGQKPIINSVVFGTDSAKAIRWTLTNVTIEKSVNSNAVFIHPNSAKIRLLSSEIVLNDKEITAIEIHGNQCKIENNMISNSDIGIKVVGQKNQIRNNKIVFFTKDAIQIAGNYNLFEYNLIKESVSFNKQINNGVLFDGETLKGNVIRGNTVINFIKVSRENIGNLNGIFNGKSSLSETIIENNIIVINGDNGIALSGEISNSKIVNNTVVNPYFGLNINGSTKINSALAINIKGAGTSNNVIIRNNLANNIVLDKINGLADHNITLPVEVHEYDLNFKNWALFDFSLSENSKALNKGIAEFAPKFDASLNQRSLGNFVNVGAFEFTKINDANEKFVITAELTDRQVHSKGKADWDGQAIIRIGGSGEGIDGAGVYPFKLPLIPGGKEIISTNFITYYKNVDNKPTGGIDVYGLAPKTNFWVTNDMFYQGTFGQDLKARPIQNNYIDSETIPGTTALSAQGQIGLKNYINTIFETGSKAGDFIFLRLNPSAKDITDYHRWNFVSANSEKEERKPKLEITVGYPALNKGGAANIKAIQNTIVASANPMKNGEVSLYFLGFEKNKNVKITLFTFKGIEVLNTNLQINDIKNQVYRTKKLSVEPGKYILEYTVDAQTKKQTIFIW